MTGGRSSSSSSSNSSSREISESLVDLWTSLRQDWNCRSTLKQWGIWRVCLSPLKHGWSVCLATTPSYPIPFHSTQAFSLAMAILGLVTTGFMVRPDWVDCLVAPACICCITHDPGKRCSSVTVSSITVFASVSLWFLFLDQRGWMDGWDSSDWKIWQWREQWGSLRRSLSCVQGRRLETGVLMGCVREGRRPMFAACKAPLKGWPRLKKVQNKEIMLFFLSCCWSLTKYCLLFFGLCFRTFCQKKWVYFQVSHGSCVQA